MFSYFHIFFLFFSLIVLKNNNSKIKRSIFFFFLYFLFSKNFPSSFKQSLGSWFLGSRILGSWFLGSGILRSWFLRWRIRFEGWQRQILLIIRIKFFIFILNYHMIYYLKDCSDQLNLYQLLHIINYHMVYYLEDCSNQLNLWLSTYTNKFILSINRLLKKVKWYYQFFFPTNTKYYYWNRK